uniref:Uncharacterized protein n=1 Tax=Solanum tuberosum TaxID=4113 RepID=M1E081_SOLTU
MNQSAILKKKGSNPNKAQSPLKNLDFDMQYRSSAELANKFKIKRGSSGNGEVQHDIEDLLNFKHVKRKSVRPATTIDQFLDNQRIHNEHDIHDLPNCKQVKRKSVIPTNSLNQLQKNQGIRIDDETKRDNHTIADVEFMHAPIINEHNKGLDDLVDQEELGGDECDVEEEIDIDCSTKAKDNNEEPSKPEMFIATRTKTGKEIQADTQVAIAELQNRQNSGEIADDAFRAVFGKEQPGRLRFEEERGLFEVHNFTPLFESAEDRDSPAGFEMPLDTTRDVPMEDVAADVLEAETDEEQLGERDAIVYDDLAYIEDAMFETARHTSLRGTTMGGSSGASADVIPGTEA